MKISQDQLTQETLVSLRNAINAIEHGAVTVHEKKWEVISRDLPYELGETPMVENIGERLVIETRYIGGDDNE